MKHKTGFVSKTLCMLSLLLPALLLAQTTEGVYYLHPKPGTGFHAKETVLLFRFSSNPGNISNRTRFCEVRGEASGSVVGDLVDGTDGRTLIFRPTVDFIPGERVFVHLRPIVQDSRLLADTSYTFTISPNEASGSEGLKTNNKIPAEPNPCLEYTSFSGDPVVVNGIALPSNYPQVDISVNDNPGTDPLFVNAFTNRDWSLILDSQGNPVWYWFDIAEQMNFKAQPDGKMTVNLRDGRVFAWDSTFALVREYQAPPGYPYIDPHEFISLPNGHYWIIVNNEQIMDLSQQIVGGHPEARVQFNTVMEVDANDNPIFIWRSWDYFDVTDTYDENDLTGDYIDLIHMNTIDFDNDGHILVCSRHLNEVTKINRHTGEIIWRLGGKNDDFTWVNDNDRIAHQHTCFSLPNGNYTIFDNGNGRIPEYSRAIEIALDTIAWTATIVWEHRDGDRFCWSESSAQRLPNGNTLIDWKEDDDPAITEVRPDGSKAFEMRLGPDSWSYRAFRFNWQGKAKVPYLVAEPHYDRITLIFNKFGDTDVAYYNIYGDKGVDAVTLLDSTTQPFIHLSDLENDAHHMFRVTSVSGSGEESDFSNQVTVYVHFVSTGENMVQNGDFEQGFDHWYYESDDPDDTWEIVDGELHFRIQNGGPDAWPIRLYNEITGLENGATYLFEYEAYASSERVFQAEIISGNPKRTNYSQIGYTFLTTVKQKFSHTFTMTDPYESNARIIFYAGGSTHDVAIDNVSLKLVNTHVDDADDNIPDYTQLHQNYPNPFNTATTIRYVLEKPFHVSLKIFNIAGREVAHLVDERRDAGVYKTEFNAQEFPSGIYIYKLTTDHFVQSKKLLLSK